MGFFYSMVIPADLRTTSVSRYISSLPALVISKPHNTPSLSIIFVTTLPSIKTIQIRVRSSGDEPPDAAKDLCALCAAKGAGYFLLILDHSNGSSSFVNSERHPEIVHEGKYRISLRV